jgi:hypothetical protein
LLIGVIMREFTTGTFRKFLPKNLRGIELLFVALLFSPLSTSCQKTTVKQSPQTEQNAEVLTPTQTTDGFYQLSSSKPVTLNVNLQEIRPSNKVETFQTATATQHKGSSRKYINEELNSRLTVKLPDGEWKMKWQSKLPTSSFTPSAIIETKDRIIIETDGVWLLFDKAGNKLQQGVLGASGISADDENFYAADSTGLIVARRLSDGVTVFGLSLYFGNKFQRTFMSRKGQHFLVVSTERTLNPERREAKENSLMEAIDLGKPLKTDADGLLKSAQPLSHLARKTRLLLTALHDETIVLATQNRVYLSDANLNISRAFTGEFTPLKISLDEAGRIYLIVEAKNRRLLWLLLPTGELATTFDISSSGQPLMPPIIGYNHYIYLVTADKVLSISPGGKLIWRTTLEKEISSAAVTANDQLLVSTENEISAFDVEGRRRILFTFSDERITTPPVLIENGEILVASKKSLYCLSSH